MRKLKIASLKKPQKRLLILWSIQFNSRVTPRHSDTEKQLTPVVKRMKAGRDDFDLRPWFYRLSNCFSALSIN